MAIGMLPRDELALGRAILLATDSLGMSAEGAFWIFDEEEDKWHYFLVTSLFNRVGPREIYLKLGAALQEKLSEQEVREFSLFISDPSEDMVEEVREEISTSAHASDPKDIEAIINGENTRLVVYRMSNGLSEDNVKKAKRRFSKIYNEVVAA